MIVLTLEIYAKMCYNSGAEGGKNHEINCD